MKQVSLYFLGLLAGLSQLLSAQTLQVNPVFPTQNDTVTITYDASQGNGALANHSGAVYAHTGVITASGGAGNWQYVQGNWGTAHNKVKMNSLGNDLYEISFHIPSFYNFPGGTTVNQLAFVFRNANGSIVGREADGSDIFYTIYSASSGFLATITKPSQLITVNPGATVDLAAAANQQATLSLYDNGNLVVSDTSVNQINHSITATGGGLHQVELVATNGSTLRRDTGYYFVNPNIQVGMPPAQMEYGINYLNDSTVFLKLLAPQKNSIYVIGDFNNWLPDTAHFMNRTPDGTTWWLEVSGLTPGQSYGFQYVIDSELKLADPYSEVVLDQHNDQYIPSTVYPNLHPYPQGKTSGFVTVIYPGEADYNWHTANFQAPDKEELIIFELLIRDFDDVRSYQSVIDAMGYFKTLGINAIELMPVNEFEGNESWGYNPSFHMALDKYYGPRAKFKELIDSCHSNGIAVIMDMVYNHAFGQSPLVQMYWDASNNRPASNNPWFNSSCPHPPYCWGNDFNHEAQVTKDFMDQVNTYWIEEFKIDGIRFDYTKGFTNGGDSGYDNDRINLLKRMADTLWKLDSDFYVILEHWADNNEEKILSNYGMMLWGNVAHAYQEAAMGFIPNSNFAWGIASERGWNDKHLISYFESHDEERVMYKTLTYGNSAGSYDTRNLSTALDRQELVSLFTYAIPGPKMIYQFSELGYDVSIDDPCRICVKPVRWNYFQQPQRLDVYKMTSALLQLRQQEAVFNTDNFSHGLAGSVKYLHLNGSDLKVVAMGNFDVNQRSANPNFQHSGTWYEYFSGDSILVSQVNDPILLNPGEYRLYLSEKRNSPYISLEESAVGTASPLHYFPNPAANELNLYFQPADGASQQAELSLINLNGQRLKDFSLQADDGLIQLPLETFPAGLYFLEMKHEGQLSRHKLLLQ